MVLGKRQRSIEKEDELFVDNECSAIFYIQDGLEHNQWYKKNTNEEPVQ